VFGITLERPAVEVDLQPDAFAHVWTAPATPSYTVTLRNTSSVEQRVALDLSAEAFDKLRSQFVGLRGVKLAAEKPGRSSCP